MGYDYQKFRNSDRIKKTFPFSSQKKKSAVCYKDDKGKFYVFVKGSPDFTYPSCSHFVNKNGENCKIDQTFRD